MKKHLTKLMLIVGLGCSVLFLSCSMDARTGDSFTEDEIHYLKSLGLLDEDETIILFDSQGSYGKIILSGNFFTNKRIASYWHELEDSSKNQEDFAYYHDIDTIIPVSSSTYLTYASYLEVHKKDGEVFKVYIDADEEGIQDFFDKAIAEWRKNKEVAE